MPNLRMCFRCPARTMLCTKSHSLHKHMLCINCDDRRALSWQMIRPGRNMQGGIACMRATLKSAGRVPQPCAARAWEKILKARRGVLYDKHIVQGVCVPDRALCEVDCACGAQVIPCVQAYNRRVPLELVLIAGGRTGASRRSRRSCAAARRHSRCARLRLRSARRRSERPAAAAQARRGSHTA